MMYTKKVLDTLGGYDDTLTYEDFDFWIRSSRNFKYCYTDEILVKKRTVSGSKSVNQSKFRSPDVKSTYMVMKKIKGLLRNKKERQAFRGRLLYEFKVAVEHMNIVTALKYLRMILL